MSERPAGDAELLHAALDGALDANGERRLSARLADPAFADALARMLLLEEAIRRECSSAGEIALLRSPTPIRIRSHVGSRWAAIAAALVAIVALLWSGLPNGQALAESLLARVAARATVGDRSFRLSIPDGQASDRSLDGAILHLGSRGQYVLIRHDPDGRPLVSGSDGVSAWFVPAEGAVRVSASPSRFRGHVPGQQFDLPFLDPAAGVRFAGESSLGLGQLADLYELRIRSVSRGGEPQRTVVEATRREGVRRGPKRVTVEIDPAGLQIERMRFDRLPQAKDGPRSVVLERIPAVERPQGFFGHAAHHAPDRPIRLEP